MSIFKERKGKNDSLLYKRTTIDAKHTSQIKIFKDKKKSKVQLEKSLKDMKIELEELSKIDKKVKIFFVKDRPGHDTRYALNSKKIEKELKWKAKIKINEGLSKTIDWYINNQKYLKSISKKTHTNRLGLKI